MQILPCFFLRFLKFWHRYGFLSSAFGHEFGFYLHSVPVAATA